MNQGIIGLNILGDRQFDRAALITYVRQLQPAFCVVMNSPSLAADLLPYTIVICRFTPDDNAQNYTSGAEFVQSRRKSVPSGAYLYLTNEPGRGAVKRLNDFTLEAQAEAGDLKLCILNWSTGVPEPGDWDIVALCIENAVKRDDLIGVHNYWNDDPFGGFSFHWHVGRFEVAQKRFGGQWVVTELGYLKLKPDAQPPEMDGGAGWQTDISEGQYKQAFEHLAPYYTRLRAGVCIFSWPDWDQRGFGIEHATGELQPHLIALNQRYRLKDGEVATYPAGTNPEQKKVNQPAGLRLRTLPSTAATTIRPLSFGEVVTAFAQPVIHADGYDWQRVTDAYGNNGWAANAVSGRASFVDPSPVPPPAQAWIVNLPVPHVSQIDSDSRLSNNDCSLASLLMLLRHWFKQRGMGIPVLPTVDDLERHTALADPNPPNSLTFAQIMTLGQQLCFPLTYSRPLNESEIVRHLDAGRPVMALVGYAEFNPAAHESFNHFAVIIGHNDTEFNVHDPYKGGANYRISRQRFMNAMQQVGDNLPNQGLVLQMG